MSNDPGIITFVLTGAKAGKTIGLQRRANGTFTYDFVDGKMQMHASRVTGRLIEHLRTCYSAVIEDKSHGSNQDAASGNNSSGSEDLHDNGATTPKPSVAAETSIKLTGSDNAASGSEEQPAVGRDGQGSDSQVTKKKVAKKKTSK